MFPKENESSKCKQKFFYVIGLLPYFDILQYKLQFCSIQHLVSLIKKDLFPQHLKYIRGQILIKIFN